MHEARARVEAEALEADRAGRRLEGLRVVVRHGDVEGDALHVLRRLGAADGAVVLGAAVGGEHDQRLAEPQRAAPAACRAPPRSRAACRCRGRRSRRARSSPSARRPSGHRASGCRRSWDPPWTRKGPPVGRALGVGLGWVSVRRVGASARKQKRPAARGDGPVQQGGAGPHRGARKRSGRSVDQSRHRDRRTTERLWRGGITGQRRSRIAAGRHRACGRETRALLLVQHPLPRMHLQRTRMAEDQSIDRGELLALTAEIVAAHVGNNAVAGTDLGAADPVGLRHAARTGVGRAGGSRSS